MKTVAITVPFSQEKGLVSKLLTSIAMLAIALFLTTSLSGCGEKGVPEAGSASYSMTDSGKVKVVLRPGSKYITLRFSARDVAKRQAEVIRNLLQDAGVRIEDTSVQLDSGGQVAFQVGVIKSDVILFFEKNNLEFFRVESALWKKLTQWDPSHGSAAVDVG